ncbi:GNAT family N-acetyltransferase [Sphaerotilus sp.]|uniref:GNAT family N-acetyltransferase n=1 Tax=Sphaerotilus sp. TaxID=2093942 RepID=UPI0034E25A33
MLLTDVTRPLPLSDRPVPVSPPARPTASSLVQHVVIEPARLSDWASICKLVAQNFPLQTEVDMGYWLCHQLPYFQVARLDGHVIGFMHAQPRQDTGTLWVNLLAVDEQYRHRGVGHQLVMHVESVCRDWGCLRIGLQCLHTNVAGLALYRQHGYARLVESITELGHQVIVHRKTLPVTDAPASCPRPPVQLDGRLRRIAYRLFYLAWFRRHSPVRG